MEHPSSPTVTPPKQYTIASCNKSRTKITATPGDCQAPAFDFDVSFFIKDFKSNRKSHSIVMRPSSVPSSDSDAQVIGVCDINPKSIESPIHLCFGDPDSSANVTWETLHCKAKLKTNTFELSMDLGSDVGKKVFVWKRTHDVEERGMIMRQLDWLNLKMVERESERVVARFVHHPWYGKKRGYFEIEEFEGGKAWNEVVLLSGMGVLEYLRKVSGYSW